MKSVTIFFGCLFYSITSFAIGLENCGDYSFQGTAKIIDKQMILILNESTQSEFKLSIPKDQESRITPYLNLTVKGDLVLKKVTGPWTGEIKEFKKIDYGIPDPLNTTKHTFLKLKKKASCR